MDLATDKMLCVVKDGVGTMTYNHPERRNAVNHEMRLALIEILTSFAEDPEIRVVVVTGAGGKAFVSGADVSEFDTKRSNPEQIAEYNEVSRRAGAAWAMVDKPIIAMIRGYCLGGGLATALNADIRIATEDSQFGIPAARLGLGFGFGGVFPVYTVIVREHLPISQAGRWTGMVFMFGAGGMGLGSWIGGVMFDLTGTYFWAFLIGVGFNVVNLLIILALKLRSMPMRHGGGAEIGAG